MRYTENYNLKKPEELDPVDIQDLNYNADVIDSKLKEVEDWEAAHLQASNPHSITPILIGAETPTGAQAKVNAHEQKAAPHSGHETPAGAQAKANIALAEAKLYAENVANSALNSAKDYADVIDSKLKEVEDWEAAHLQASNPHSITPILIGAETPTGAQAKVNAHEQKAAPHSGHETPAGAQAKANTALAEAKLYAENVANSALNSAKDYADEKANQAETNAKSYADQVASDLSNQAETNAKSYADQVASDLSQKLNETRIKVLDVERDVSNISKVLTSLNPNQEATQSVSGYGIISLPKNAANGQVGVSVKGNTYTNFVKNGNFANGTSSWESTNSGTLSTNNNTLVHTGNGTNAVCVAINIGSLLKWEQASKIFIRTTARVTNANASQITLRVDKETGSATVAAQINSPVQNQWYTLYGIVTRTDQSGKAMARIDHIYADAATANGKVMEVREVFAINLDQYPELANLTADQINARIPHWFDSTKSTVSAIRAKSVTEYEPYKESVAYITAKDESGNILELRSLPNGTKDEVNVTEGKYIQRIGVDETDPNDPTFIRSSVAYLPDGTQVDVNMPRFEQGRFGQAVLIEEGTTNIAHDPNSDNAWWNAAPKNGISWGLSNDWSATEQALKVRSYGSSYHGHSFYLDIQRDVYFTLRAKIKNVKNALIHPFCLALYNSAGICIKANYVPEILAQYNWLGHNTPNYTEAWITYRIPSGVFTDAVKYTVQLLGSGTSESEIYLKDIQLEQKPYKTTWHPYNSTRSPETLTIPTEGILFANEGTITLWAYITERTKDNSSWRYLFDCRVGYSKRIYLARSSGGLWYSAIIDDNGIQNTIITDDILSIGWHNFCLRWDSSEFALFIDGEKIGNVINPSLPSAFGAELYLGCSLGQNPNGAEYSNSIFDELRISSRARTDQEIAAAYASGQPLPVDEWTAYKLGFDDNLNKKRATPLIYQLAEPIEVPIQTSGSLVSYPSGTVYVEPFVADAGIYTNKMTVLHLDLPIKTLEKLSKIDFMAGLETELDVSDAVIAEDKLSFTHPDLVEGDIVFFVYEHGAEGTIPETEISYYDSRYVIKDSVTEKFYKWRIAVADGVPSIELTEV